MHNVSGGASGIEIEFIPEGAHASNLWPAAEIPTGDPTAATIAGYHAAYWNLGAGREEWAIDIDGTKFSIRLLAHPGTTEDELAAAHAVIESIAKEPQEQEPGFMLTFTLPHGWDSG
jgi:hypothetical protein